jgi:hypothetical protein
MLNLSVMQRRGILVIVACVAGSASRHARAQTAGSGAEKPAEIRIADGPIPMRVLAESPAETETELQVICLFRSDPVNTLHGSLLETNEKLKGLLDRVRKPTLIRGELGETLLLRPPSGSMGAKQILIIGLGDSETFAPERMELVGAVAYREANRLGVAHPFFAPTVLDGGVTKFNTGQVAEQVARGVLRAVRTDKLISEASASAAPAVRDLTFLAGVKHAADTQQGIEKAIAEDAGR